MTTPAKKMEGVRAIAAPEGLIISMSKKVLNALKYGDTATIDLITGKAKVHVLLMRDSTYKEKQRDLHRMADRTQKHEADLVGLADELAKPD